MLFFYLFLFLFCIFSDILFRKFNKFMYIKKIVCYISTICLSVDKNHLHIIIFYLIKSLNSLSFQLMVIISIYKIDRKKIVLFSPSFAVFQFPSLVKIVTFFGNFRRFIPEYVCLYTVFPCFLSIFFFLKVKIVQHLNIKLPEGSEI